MNDEQRKQRLMTGAKWVLGLGAAVLISPVIFLAVKGIVGLAIAGILGLALVNFAPVVAMKFANWKIKGIKHEAATNPIETMEVLTLKKHEAYRIAVEQHSNKIAAKNTYARQAKEFAASYPDRAAEFMDKLQLMQASCEKSARDLEKAKHALDLADQKLDELRAYWKMTQATLVANQAMNMDMGDVYARMKEDTACDAVFEAMDRAFADLEASVGEPTQYRKDLSPEEFLRGAQGVPEFVTANAKERAK